MSSAATVRVMTRSRRAAAAMEKENGDQQPEAEAAGQAHRGGLYLFQAGNRAALESRR